MRRAFWWLIHLLPWSITRHVCDMCAEFPSDPHKHEFGGEDVEVTGPPSTMTTAVQWGWYCDHSAMTGGNLIGPTKCPHGCVMKPGYANRTWSSPSSPAVT